MVKIRIEGTSEEIIKAQEIIKKSFDVLQESQLYPNRGKSKYYRAYIEVEIKSDKVIENAEL